MTVTSAEEFFAILEKSNLLIPSQLAQARSAAGDSDDPTTIAKNLARQELLTRWQAGQLLAGRSSFYLGKYRLIELLGRGGMGSVFLGQHVTMNRRVALKIISRQVSKDRASLDRFLAEARAIAALDHPNIVRAYSVDNEGDRYYLVMEYVEGMDLQQLVDENGPLDCDRAVDYICQAAGGLAHAHQRNMIHCDIKPSNLLVNTQGVVKILDMGLARLTGGDSETVEQDERVLGTVDYLAPEQAMRSPDMDHRADIYSLGCTLYFLLTGHSPFSQGTLPERILKHQTQEPPDIRAEQPKVSAEVAAICKKMMAKDPGDRYQTAAEVGGALAEWRTATPQLKRVISLPKAKPLDDNEFFGIDLGEERSRQLLHKREDSSIVGKRGHPTPSAAAIAMLKTLLPKLVATRRRIVGVVLAGVLALLGLVVLIVVLWGQAKMRSLRMPVAKAVRTAPSTKTQPQPAAEPEPVKPEPPKPVPPKQEPPKTEPPKPEPPKPEPPKQEPPKQEPPKPEPPKQEPPKPEPPKPVNPLAELVDAVDLPPLPEKGNPPPADGGVSLGKVASQQAAELVITLIGGEEILRSGRKFEMEREGSALSWLIRWKAEAKGSTPATEADVARVSLDQDALHLRWLAGAADVSAGYLSNCGLLATVGQTSRLVALCRPQAVEAIVLDLDRRIIHTKVPRSNISETGVLRFQVTGFSGSFPEHCTMNPPDPVGPKSNIDISFGDTRLSAVVLRAGFELKPVGVQVDTGLLYQLPGQAGLSPFNVKLGERLASQTFAMRNQFQNMFDKMDPNDPRRKALQQEVDAKTAIVEQMTALSELYKSVNRQAKMHYCLFNQFSDRQIMLLTTPPPTMKLDTQSPGFGKPTDAMPTEVKKPPKKRK